MTVLISRLYCTKGCKHYAGEVAPQGFINIVYITSPSYRDDSAEMLPGELIPHSVPHSKPVLRDHQLLDRTAR